MVLRKINLQGHYKILLENHDSFKQICSTKQVIQQHMDIIMGKRGKALIKSHGRSRMCNAIISQVHKHNFTAADYKAIHTGAPTNICY